MLMSELTAPKLTEMPKMLVPATILPLRSTSPVSNDMTAPAPLACEKWSLWPGSVLRPG